jgi:lipopolysaccharide biosynthesis protein
MNKSLSKVIHNPPIETPLILGNRAMRAGDFGLAKDYYLKALEERPELHKMIQGNLEFSMRLNSSLIDTDSCSYLTQIIDNLDVNKHNSFLHIKEVLNNSALFDKPWYAAEYIDIIEKGFDLTEHYLTFSKKFSLAPSPLFDTDYYICQLPHEVKDKIISPLYHYLMTGWRHYDPNPYFSTPYYLYLYSDVLGNLTPLEHFATQPSPFIYNPSPIFSNLEYSYFNEDVFLARLNPLWHYLSSGKAEGRSLRSPGTLEIANTYIVYTTEICPEDNILVYVAYSPSGALSALQIDMIEAYAILGYKVILVVNSGDFTNRIHPGHSKASICILRENIGFDFGAWRTICNYFTCLDNVNSITFTNDSIALINDLDKTKSFLEPINEIDADIITLTKNYEIHEHYQSYFFTVKKSAIKKNVLDLFRNIDYFLSKDKIIHTYELKIWDRFLDLGVTIKNLYPRLDEGDIPRNPTIHFWKELIDIGFPFLKIQLFTSGFKKLEDHDIFILLSKTRYNLFKDHINSREGAVSFMHPDLNFNIASQPAVITKARFGSIGQLQGYNPSASQSPTIMVPINGEIDLMIDNISRDDILVIIHCFYVDIAQFIFERLAVVSDILKLRILCTTDTIDKYNDLILLLQINKLNGTVVLTQNRGRDVAPFLIEGAKHLGQASYVLHLHTKKSPHSSDYEKWGEFIFENLIGSKEIILSNLLMLSSHEVGMIYSEHFSHVRGLRNWGFDFDHAKNILANIGVNITSENLLEFPTSTMFWARIEAIRPLFNLKLSYDDFEEELGQTDGTLAHAIERSLIYTIESVGFYGIKVLSTHSKQKDPCWKISANDLEFGLKGIRPTRLLGSDGDVARKGCFETYPVNIIKSPSLRPRLNILIPTMQPEKIYGGVSTAIKVAKDLYKFLGEEYDIRLIVVSDLVNYESIVMSCSLLAAQLLPAKPNDDYFFHTIVDLYLNRFTPLSIRKNDIFYATAWWTADLGIRLHNHQYNAFNYQLPLVYLIQDYEPGFYTWSERSSLARATYINEDIVAIINSEELANFITHRYVFRKTYHVPYELNETLASKRISSKKEQVIVVYGRPSVDRNLFGIIIKGLKNWQAINPKINTAFKIVFAGEEFNYDLITSIESATVVGKLTLNEYADLLNKSVIGISLMESPHPSYPPLEMASFGCITITNSYENKNLSLRSSNIISIAAATPILLSQALTDAMLRLDFINITPKQDILPIPCDIQVINYQKIAADINNQISLH